MNLTSPSQVKGWCIENGFHPNRVLGQNFLVDGQVHLGVRNPAKQERHRRDRGGFRKSTIQ